MNPQSQNFLSTTADYPMRSRLEPHRDLIRELRRKRYPYRKIASILEQHFALKTSKSALHDFVKVRSRNSRRLQLTIPPPPSSSYAHSPMQPSVDPQESATIGGPSVPNSAKPEALQAHIEAIKRSKRNPPAPTKPTIDFYYEEGEPLRLMPDPPQKK